MNVNYCDLCGCVIKENNFFSLYIADTQNANTIEDYHEYLKYIRGGVKEICPICKHIFDRMFELRLKNLSELVDEINFIYNLKSKERPDDKKKK